MKKSLLTTIGALLLSISAFAYSGGNGTEAYPYLISSKADMQELASNTNGGNKYSGKYFRLTRDLTGANDTITTAVGDFSGIFEGDGHEIAVNYQGVFKYIGGATIKNLGVSGRISYYSSISSTLSMPYRYYHYAGGICERASASTISNCYSSAEISVTISFSSSYYYYLYGGGICGYNDGSDITNCYNTGNVSVSLLVTSPSSSPPSYSYGGGICGYINGNSNITDSYNRGNISSSSSSYDNRYSYSGGICGYAYNNSSVVIDHCYSTGNVASISSSSSSNKVSYSGGICGYLGKIQNCFVANSQITNINDVPQARIGRIGGDGGSYANCHADDFSVSINGNPIGNSNANSKNGKDATVANFQDLSWLTTTLSWDFDDTWKVNAGEFPQHIRAAKIAFVLPAVYYGDQTPLNATSDNLVEPITYESSDPAIAEISGGFLLAKKAGTVTITASQEASAGFLAGRSSVSLTVRKKELTVTANPASITYGEALPTTAYTCQYEGFISGDEAATALSKRPSFVCTATAQSDAGKYAITPQGAESANYTFIYVADSLTINKCNLRVIPNNTTRIYGYANPAFAFSYDGFVYGNTAENITPPTASTTATLASPAGEYLITCTGGNATNYSFTYETGTLAITKAPLTVSVASVSRNYGSPNPAFTVTYSGFRNSDNKNSLTVQPQATSEATTTSNVGAYPITLSGGAAVNYEFTYTSGTLTINRAPVTIAAQPASSIYGDMPPTYTYLCSGFVNNETETVLTQSPTLSCTATATSNAGQYTITPSGAVAQNYTFTYQSGTLTIAKRNLTVTPNDASRIYGDANPSFALNYDGFVNGNTTANITVKPTPSTVATPTSAVGEYPITCSGGTATNYSFTYGTGTLTVTKAPLTASVASVSRNYGSPNPTFTVTYSGFRNSDNKNSLTVQPQATCEATATSNVGAYPIIPAGGVADNYEFTYTPGELTINRAPVTITAQPASSVYGDTPPTYTYLCSGFVNNETESVLTQQPTLSCTATATSNAGQYTITPSGAVAQNYTFTYQSGTLTIAKRNLTVTPNDASRIYGDVNPSLTLDYSGFVNGNTTANIAVKPTASTVATPTSVVGEYPITCSGGTATNYSFTYGTGTLTVTKAPLTASVASVSRNYGSPNPTFSISYSGFRNSDNKNSLTVQPQATCEATVTSDAGTYLITPAGGEAQNYTFTYQPGTLTIAKAELIVQADDKQRKQGEANPEFTLSYNGFKNDEDASVLDELPSITCLADETSPIGFYGIQLSGGSDNNYAYTFIDGRLEVIAGNAIKDVQAAKVSVYPNPAKNDLYVKSDVPVKQVELIDFSGRTVGISSGLYPQSGIQTIDVSALPAGLYFVRVYTEDACTTEKIQKVVNK